MAVLMGIEFSNEEIESFKREIKTSLAFAALDKVFNQIIAEKSEILKLSTEIGELRYSQGVLAGLNRVLEYSRVLYNYEKKDILEENQEENEELEEELDV